MRGTPPPPEWRVPVAHWDRAPWNRWTFHHVREMVPTAEVWRGAGPVLPLARDDRDVTGVSFESVSGGTTTVAELLATTFTDGFLVAIGGRVVHESYHGTMDARSPHLSQSVAKSVTALAAGVLVGEGLLDPAAPVTDVLPELDQTAWDGATLQHVLDMTSGVRFSEAYEDHQSDIGRLDVAAGWKPVPPKGDWPRSIWDQILRLKTREAEHGSRFAYRSIETDVLGHAMERATGQRLPEIVSNRLWQHIGAEESAAFTVDRAGYGLACGGFNATLRDYARVGQLLLDGGRAGGRQVVPEFWIEDIFAGPHGLFNDEARLAYPNGVYRNQFWVEDRDRGTVMAKGIFGQMIMADRDAGLVAVKLSAWPQALVPAFDQDTRRAVRAIQAELGA